MGRKSSYSVGQIFGKLEIVEILPSNTQGKHVKLRCLCGYCGNTKIMNGSNIKRRNSCGCKQNDSNEWKSVGPKSKPWQLEYGQAAKNNLEYQYKRSAQKRNLQYELTTEEFIELVTGICNYCHRKDTQIIRGQGKTSGDFHYTGIDRINSDVGYVKYNCVSCCWDCNDMKKDRNVETFREHIRRIYNTLNKENNELL
jgi:hypothetical protein